MRTTLTLDEDVAILLRRHHQERGLKFKMLVNAALRAGLLALESRRPPTMPYRTRSVSVGKCLVENLDCIPEVLAFAEGEAYK